MRVEKVAIALSFLAGITVLLISLISLYNNFTQAKPLKYLIVDIVFYIVGLLLIAGSLRLYKRLVMLEVITESAFEEIIYERLKPVLEEIAFNSLELNDVKSRIHSLEKKLERIEDEMTKEPVHAPDSLALRRTAFYMRTIVVMTFFLGMYVFLLNYNYLLGPTTPYLYMLLYLIWWLFITKEFNLFERVEAWVVFCIPILLVPMGSIILRAVLGLAPLMGIIFATASVYAYLYYLYARKLVVDGQSLNIIDRLKKCMARGR